MQNYKQKSRKQWMLQDPSFKNTLMQVGCMRAQSPTPRGGTGCFCSPSGDEAVHWHMGHKEQEGAGLAQPGELVQGDLTANISNIS